MGDDCASQRIRGVLQRYWAHPRPADCLAGEAEGRPFVDDQAKEALNFQISWTIYMLGSVVLCFVFIGFFFLIGLAIFHVVCMIIAGLKANDGCKYRYPLTIRFLT